MRMYVLTGYQEGKLLPGCTKATLAKGTLYRNLNKLLQPKFLLNKFTIWFQEFSHDLTHAEFVFNSDRYFMR